MLKITKNQGSIQVTADKSGFYPFDGTITFPTNSLFTATSANTDMITFKSTSNGDVQFVGNYKDITISGRSYDTKQKFLTAFSNLANQGSVDAYTKAETDAKLDAKQNKLKAGNGITIDENNVISSTGGSGGSANPYVNVKGTNESATIADDVTNGIAIGERTEVTKGESIAIGNQSQAKGRYCVSVGRLSTCFGDSTVAVGDNAKTTMTKAVAIGSGALAMSKNAIAIGPGANATSNMPLVIKASDNGLGAALPMIQGDKDGKISIPLGDGTLSTMCLQDEIAALKNAGGSGGTVDAYTKAETDTKLEAKQDKLTSGSGITIGQNTINDGVYNVLIGDLSRAGELDDQGSVIIGSNANGASGTTSTLIGFSASSSGFACTGIGPTARVDDTTPLVIKAGHKTVSDGEQILTMIQGDANGKISLLKGDGTDERMVIQDEIEALKNAGGSGGTVDAYTKAETDTKLDAKQDKLTAGSGITITKDETAGTSTIATAVSLTDNGNGAYAVGDSIGIGGRLSVRIGNNTSALKGQNSIVIGDHAVVNDKNSIAIGDQAITNSENCIAIGNNTNTTYYTTNCVVIGNHAQAASSYCTVIGPGARSNTSYAVAVGYNIYIDSKGRNSVAVGSDTKAYGKNSVAIGYSSEATDDTPLVIKAGNKTVNGVSKPLTVLQSDANGKISLLKGDGTDERMVIQDEIAALKAEIAALKGGASTGDTTGA